MIRILIRLAVYFAAAAIGLIVAAAIFDGVEVDTLGFVEVAAIYALILALITPALERSAARGRNALSGGVGLGATFLALLATVLISDNLTVDGVGTWIGATIVVWLATMIAGLLLPILVVKHVVDERHRP